MKNQLLVFFLFSSKLMMAQDSTDYFYQIPDYPSTYTATTVVARMVDGLGFRYYWATDGLRTEDLDFSPSEEARTSRETLDHIYSLIQNLHHAVHQIPTVFPAEKESLNFMEKRENTLALLKDISEILKKSEDEDLELFKMIFEGPSYSAEYPFWNELNGPLADALWHVGQVVTFRRSSGNPFNGKVSVLKGVLTE